MPVPASPQLTAEEAAFLVEDADARAVVTTPEMRLPDFTGMELPASEIETLDGAGPLPETDAEDPAFLIYTSGTSSRPKGVLHAQRSIRGRALMRQGWEDFGPDDVTLHAGTLNWSYTLGVGLMDPWAAGSHALLFGGAYDPARWPRLIERLGVTVFVAVPTVYRQLLKYGRPEEADLSALRHGLCAGEPLPAQLLREWRRRAGAELYEALGMTEVSTYVSSGPSFGGVRPGSPGRPQPGRRVAILPQDGGTQPLPPGEVGLLAVHRSDPGLMLGYWRRPQEQAAVYRGEWFIGGDLAAIDQDGYLWFHGRADDVIKSFGYGSRRSRSNRCWRRAPASRRWRSWASRSRKARRWSPPAWCRSSRARWTMRRWPSTPRGVWPNTSARTSTASSTSCRAPATGNYNAASSWNVCWRRRRAGRRAGQPRTSTTATNVTYSISSSAPSGRPMR